MTKKTNITESNKSPIFRKVSTLVEIEAQQRVLKARADEIKAELLTIMQMNKALQLKTEGYCVTRAKRITPQIEDFNKLRKSLDKADIPYDVVEAFAPHMSETFKQIVKSGKELDGLAVKETEYVAVRIAK